jgi:hypothetical protein
VVRNARNRRALLVQPHPHCAPQVLSLLALLVQKYEYWHTSARAVDARARLVAAVGHLCCVEHVLVLRCVPALH